jgi:imidazolonepropionase-like amidohydrolase
MLEMLLLMARLWIREPQEPPRTTPIVFTDVAVIDVSGTGPQLNRTVVVAGGRIAVIGRVREVSVPEGAHVVEASGKFLIPGLWDMHVHISSKEVFLPLFVANGITGVRDMGGDLEQVGMGNLSVRFEILDRWRKEVEKGDVVGPRIVAGGQFVDGPKPVWPGSIAVADEAQARNAVCNLKKRGVDFIKVYEVLPREAYFAVADEAKKQKLPFAGHVPWTVGAGEASDAGQKSIEHLTGVLLACSSREEECRQEILVRLSAMGFGVKPAASHRESNERDTPKVDLLETFSPAKSEALFARFARNGTWQIPTLAAMRMGTLDDPRTTISPHLKYVPAFMREAWNAKTNPLLEDSKPEDIRRRRKDFRKQLEVVAAMHRAGVKVLAGSDTANPHVVPGFSLHEELELLVEAGLSPRSALETATRNLAEYLGLLDSMGTIEVGKVADLVLLGADPTADIKNSRKTEAVVVRGRLLSKADIERMLGEVVEAASRL